MLFANTVREKTLFEAFAYTSTASAIDSNSTATNTSSTSSEMGISNGNSYTIYEIRDGGNYSNSFGNGSENGFFGATTSANVTLFSTASSSSFNQMDITNSQTYEELSGVSSFDSAGFATSTANITITITVSGSTISTSNNTGDSSQTTNSYTVEYSPYMEMTSAGALTTTTSTDVTTTHWTLGTTGTSFYPATETIFSTAITSATVTTNVTYGGESTATIGFDNIAENGLALTVEHNEWAWVYKPAGATNTAVSFFTDIADSFTATTLWNSLTTSAVSYHEYDGSAVTSHFTFDGSPSTLSFEFLISTDAATSTITSGDNLPRDTTTTTVQAWTTSSDSVSVGASYEIDDYATMSVATTTTDYQQITLHSTYPFGLSDAKITSLLSYITKVGTTSVAQAIPAYLAEATSSNYAMGVTQASTALITNSIALYQLFDANTAIEGVAPYGVFLAPQYLKSDSNTNFGTNLSFDGQTVLFPFTSGVYSNVLIPGFGGTVSTTGTDSHTWKYSWKTNSEGATLLYSHISSFLDGTATKTTATVSSGQFLTDSTLTDSFNADGGTVYGGFPADKTRGETVYFGRRAVIGTIIGLTGDSTTYKSIYSDGTVSTLSQTMIVENSTPAFVPVQAPGGGDAFQMAVYARNLDP